jgi:hypothetical protein
VGRSSVRDRRELMIEPAPRIRPESLRRLAAFALAAALCASVPLWLRARPASAAPASVTWTKDPAQITTTLTTPDQPFSFSEVLSNQGDTSGLGGFTFTVSYDATIWQAPTIDMSPGVALFAAAGRTLQCSAVDTSSGHDGIACASTGPFGSGPEWTGPHTLATVTFVLNPQLAQTLLSGGSGLQTTINDTAVQVTNSCGQPLNDGTIQPIPGQPECQGNLLPGVGPAGVIVNPGSTTITINSPPTPTPTVTATMTPQPTSSATALPSTTRTPSASPTVPTRTATAHTQTATASPSAAAGTPSPSHTGTAGTSTPGAGSTATRAAATRTSVVRGATAAAESTPPPCGYDAAAWAAHPGAWPATSLALGDEAYDTGALSGLLAPAPNAIPNGLARQLIAAKFNVATYGDQSGIGPTIAAADAELVSVGGRLPMSEPPAYIGQGMNWTAAALAAFNEHCGSLTSTVLGNTRPAGAETPTGFPRTGGIPSTVNRQSTLLVTILSLIIGVLLVVLIRRTLLADDE